MGKILCIGEALIDMICTDKGYALKDGENFLKKPGGAPTNVAAAIAALGGKAELIAKVGNDPFGKHLVNVMKHFGVGTKNVSFHPKRFTTFAFVSLLKNGERDFYFNRGADGELDNTDCDKINPEDFSIAHFGSATAFLPGKLRTAYLRMLAKCKGRKVVVSFDPNYRHLLFHDRKPEFLKYSWKFIKACDFFKVSDEEAILLTGKSSVVDAAREFSKKSDAVFAITIGPKGTLLGVNGKLITVPSIKIKPVDTTGAGDAFVGAVLYQLSKLRFTSISAISEDKWQSIIYNANLAGARTCEYMGAMEAFKYLNRKIFD